MLYSLHVGFSRHMLYSLYVGFSRHSCTVYMLVLVDIVVQFTRWL